MSAGILESLQEILGSVTRPCLLGSVETYTCLRDILDEVECAPEISSDPKCDKTKSIVDNCEHKLLRA